MIKYFLSGLLFLISFVGISQVGADTLRLKEENDPGINRRYFEEELTDKYQGEEFNYEINDGEAQNLIQRFLNWFFQTLKDKLGIDISPEALGVIEYPIYILMGILVLYLLVRFFIGEDLSSVFTKDATGLTDVNLSEEHIGDVDLEALLETALEQKDFRLAIRYQYLRALKLLSQKSIIDWHYEKTNLDYQNEISTPAIKSIFKELSYLYDYIWYGEQFIDEMKYEAAEVRFAALKDLILK